MSEILISTLAVLTMLAGLAALVWFVRNDSFAGPGTAHKPTDEFGPLGFRRRPA
jgi:hypothetical protein